MKRPGRGDATDATSSVKQAGSADPTEGTGRAADLSLLPEGTMTREELLATVHVLEPGDLLVVRLNQLVTPELVEKLQQLVRAKVPAGVDVLVTGPDVTLEQYRRVDSDQSA